MTTLRLTPAEADALRLYAIVDADEDLPFTLEGRMLTFDDRHAATSAVIDAANSADASSDYSWCAALTRLTTRLKSA